MWPGSYSLTLWEGEGREECDTSLIGLREKRAKSALEQSS